MTDIEDITLLCRDSKNMNEKEKPHQIVNLSYLDQNISVVDSF